MKVIFIDLNFFIREPGAADTKFLHKLVDTLLIICILVTRVSFTGVKHPCPPPYNRARVGVCLKNSAKTAKSMVLELVGKLTGAV